MLQLLSSPGSLLPTKQALWESLARARARVGGNTRRMGRSARRNIPQMRGQTFSPGKISQWRRKLPQTLPRRLVSFVVKFHFKSLEGSVL